MPERSISGSRPPANSAKPSPTSIRSATANSSAATSSSNSDGSTDRRRAGVLQPPQRVERAGQRPAEAMIGPLSGKPR